MYAGRQRVFKHDNSKSRTFDYLLNFQGYKVQRTSDNSTVDTPTNFAVVCKLAAGGKYELRVWAYSDAGDGPSATITITTQIISKYS